MRFAESHQKPGASRLWETQIIYLTSNHHFTATPFNLPILPKAPRSVTTLRFPLSRNS
jgi:hypothetical protein